MAVPKGTIFRMVTDYRAVNHLVAHSALPMPRLEELEALIGGPAAFCTLIGGPGRLSTRMRVSSTRWSLLAGCTPLHACHREF